MPFSRSRSPESMTRSVSSWWAPKAPVWRRSASTRVVLPWSTCATMATFLMSSRVSMGGPTIEDLAGLPFQAASALRQPTGSDGPGAAQGQLHRLGPEGEGGRLGLDPDQVAGVGPPAHHPAGHLVAPQAQGLDEGDQGQLGPDRAAPRAREHDQVRRWPCARRPGPRRARSAECGLSHQWSRPTTGVDGKRRPVEARTTGGWPTSPPRRRRRRARPATARRASGRAARRTSCRRAPIGRIRPAGAAPPRAGSAPTPPTRRRTAATPMDRRAVRAVQANGSARAGIVPVGAEGRAHLVVGHPEAGGAGAPDGEARQFRLGARRARPATSRGRRRGRAPTSASISRLSMVGGGPRPARPRGARRSPGGAPPGRPRRRSARRRTPAGPAGTGGAPLRRVSRSDR